MTTQLPLPARWAQLESRRDPRDRLDRLRSDVIDAKAKIREVLDELAERHGIRERDVTYAMEGYADDLMSDLIFHVECDLEREIEGG